MPLSLPQMQNAPHGPVMQLPQLPPGHQYRFHVMIKPVGAVCNLDCTYCFYLHKTTLLDHGHASRMSDAVLEEHVRQYIESQTGQAVVFSWQGGEPTLMGLAFFEKAVMLQAKYKRPFQRIENDLQTNGTLLDDEWGLFLKRHNFLVGLSIDGPRDLHDHYRNTKQGEGTFDRVLSAARLLKRHEVPFNALCVVNRQVAQRPLDVYRLLARDLGTYRVQFTPCVEPADFTSNSPRQRAVRPAPAVGSPAARPGNPESIVTDWSVDPEDWGTFLCKVWDEWFAKDYGKIHVNLFETAVAQTLGLPAQLCTQAEFCGKGLAIEHNGDIFSCDHFVYPDYKLGNILQTHEAEMAFSDRQKGFGFAKRDTLPRYCRQCAHLKRCWGECPKNRIVSTPDGEAGLNYLCPGFKRFYAHVQKDMPEILRRVNGGGQLSRR